MTQQNESKPSMFQGASPKLTFLFGLMIGLVATVILGALIIIPHLYSSQ